MPCPRRRGSLVRHAGRPEVAGGGWQGAATVRERTVARSRAPIWLSRPISMLVSAPLHVQYYLGGAKEGILALDALGGQWVKREEGEEWKWGCPE